MKIFDANGEISPSVQYAIGVFFIAMLLFGVIAAFTVGPAPPWPSWFGGFIPLWFAFKAIRQARKRMRGEPKVAQRDVRE